MPKKQASSKPQPSPEELSLRARVIDRNGRLFEKGMKYTRDAVIVVGGVYFGVYKTAEALAGKHTALELITEIINKLELNVAIAFGWAILGTATTVAVIRMLYVERRTNGARLIELEKKVHPDRESSGLDVKGRIGQKDQI